MICIFAFASNSTAGFGILTHEAIIDAAWEPSILPLLKQKFPNATEAELKASRAYVYGGSVIPDIGYHPLGSIFFSDLFHYVRTGDFITALLEESKTLNEYAFAIGTLCHYAADRYGHSLGTNQAVPMLFPKLKKKYGNEVSYEDAPVKHMQVEFGFDVLQTAKGNYKSDSYAGFISFKVSEEVLERAFFKTYGLKLEDVFTSVSASVETFRFSVRNVIPELTRDAWKARKSAISKLNPLATEENYYYTVNRKDYKKEHGNKFNLKSTCVAFLFGVIPKVGPLAGFRFKEPTEEAEKVFDKCLAEVKRQYSIALARLGNDKNKLGNVNLDTGEKTESHHYELTTEAYHKLLKKHKRTKFENMSPALRENIISFYNSRKTTEPKDKESKEDKALAEILKFGSQ